MGGSMKFPCRHTVILLGALCIGAITSAAAQEPPKGAGKPVASHPKGNYAALDALPDWGGVWILNRTPPGSRPRPELKGEYLEAYQAWAREVQEKDGMVARRGSYCLPPGMPGIMGVNQYPIEFLFVPGRVITHHEAWMAWRYIYTDGRPHPEPDDLDPSFFGHSIGRWEGDTLVVETVGIKDTVEMAMGMKHSPKMRILERIHLAKDDPDTLVVETTIEDPEALVKPWSYTLTYRRHRDAELIEFICNENQQFGRRIQLD